MKQTLKNIRNSTSLNNLKKDRLSGQIATLLILVITGILIFTLVVANIGQISNYATNLSNAADAASLYLASQLGTRAYQYSASLMNSCDNPVKCCVKTGLASVILAIVVAIVAIVLTCLTGIGGAAFGALFSGTLTTTATMTIVAAGVIGGAIGGAVGGAIAGTGVLQGAIQGAMIGAAIGGGVAAGVSGGLSVAAEVSLANPGVLIATASYATVGAVLGVTLAAASSIYSAYAKDAMLGDAMAAAVKALNGLPDQDRYRESIFLQALSQTVDDPNKVQDTVDSDGDGNTEEYVPAFQVWWDNRIEVLKANSNVDPAGARDRIEAFLGTNNTPVAEFEDAINTFEGNRAWLEGFFQALEDAGYPVSFWAPGPGEEWEKAKQAYEKCVEDNNGDASKCTEPDPKNFTGYDQLDYFFDELADFKAEIENLRPYLSSQKQLDELVFSWENWVTAFYDPEADAPIPCSDAPEYCCQGCSAGDYWHIFEDMQTGQSGLTAWKDEIETTRGNLPPCIWGMNDPYTSTCTACGSGLSCSECLVTPPNPPCRDRLGEDRYGTIDIMNLNNDFKAARDIIQAFNDALENFQEASETFYNDMVNLMAQNPDLAALVGVGGYNPITYEWADSRCPEILEHPEKKCHSVSVELSDFKRPRTVRKKYGNWWSGKKCIELLYHTQTVGVTITRQNPANVAMGGSGQTKGVLGIWNPTYEGYEGKIERSSQAQYRGWAYNRGWVKIVGK